MKFKKITDEGNAYGFDTIEVLKFNYDGEGHAIIKQNGELAFCHKNDLNLIMFGDPGSGDRWYELVQSGNASVYEESCLNKIKDGNMTENSNFEAIEVILNGPCPESNDEIFQLLERALGAPDYIFKNEDHIILNYEEESEYVILLKAAQAIGVAFSEDIDTYDAVSTIIQIYDAIRVKYPCCNHPIRVLNEDFYEYVCNRKYVEAIEEYSYDY